MPTPLPPAGRATPTFTGARTVLLVDDLQRASVFYEAIGFTQVDRFPPEGAPSRVGLALQGHRIDIRMETSEVTPPAHEAPATEGRQGLVLTTDDVPAAYELLLQFGGREISPPRRDAEHGQVAWLTGPDRHLVQLVSDPLSAGAEHG